MLPNKPASSGGLNKPFGGGLNKPFLGGLCFITERSATPLTKGSGTPLTSLEMALIALRAGVRWVQYRRKDASRREAYDEALMIRKLTADYGASFVVNDHPDIAVAVGAEGVHLGQDDLPLREARRIMGRDMIIGVSTHSLREAVEAEEGGADYIGFGPVFKTSTKDAGPEKGINALSNICRTLKIPVAAIGGITLESVPEIFSAGASAVAVASAILKGDIEENAREFMRKIHAPRV